MDRNLPRPRAPEFAYDQRASFHYPFNPRVADRPAPRITKMSQSSASNRHLVPLHCRDHRESEPNSNSKKNV